MSLWVWLFIVFILWILYLEFSPKLGKIIIRPNEKGGYSFSFGGVWNLMLKPFQDSTFWKPSFWDLNIYVIWIITTIIYFLIYKLS
jgi:hypothetical protein